MWWSGQNLAPDFTKPPAAVELYDHSGDAESNFNIFENANVASSNPGVVEEMMAIAKRQWEKT